MNQVVSPEQFLAEGSGLRLNGKYYITKVINPAIDRALCLLGVDVASWYNDMPRPAPRVTPTAKSAAAASRKSGPSAAAESREWGYDKNVGRGARGKRDAAGAGRGGGNRASVITNFFISDRCSLCGEQCARSVCGQCARCVWYVQILRFQMAAPPVGNMAHLC